MIRVAVTTDRFDQVEADYVAAGLEPVSMPCVHTQPSTPGQIAYARLRAASADLLVITSPRVVKLLWPDGGMPDVETAVVGPSTGAAVMHAGGHVGFIGDGGLGRLVDLAGWRFDGHVVIAHAAGSDPAAMAGLRRVAPGLEEHVVYRTTPVAPDLAAVDAVAFGSPSAVSGWSLARTLDDVVVGAIGLTTARTVSRHRDPDVIAERPSHSDLARAIATFMEVKV